MNTIKIVQVNTEDITGGAARAAYRLHQGLLAIGQNSTMLVKSKASQDSLVHLMDQATTDMEGEYEFYCQAIQWQYINENRSSASNTLFSLPYMGYEITDHELIQETDIINLHWIAFFQSPVSLKRLFSMGKPVVWTLHDQRPFTGGCHYASGCKKYQSICDICPQLNTDPYHLVESVFKDQIALYEDVDLTIVTPSQWLGQCASSSHLFKKFRIEVIPNAIETEKFHPISAEFSKEKLGLAQDGISILFIAQDIHEKRKGFNYLLQSLQMLSSFPEIADLRKKGKIQLLCLGESREIFKSIDIPILSLGYIESDESIRAIYGAADIFVLPSLEDNLPNTLLEAMSCGVPAVGFDIGGVCDVIQEDHTGKLVPVGDTQAMAQALLDLVSQNAKRQAMKINCRTAALEKYKLEIQAHTYLQLYNELLDKKRATSQIKLENKIFGKEFEKIFDAILFKSLKDYFSGKEKAFRECEADRARRLKVIQESNCEIDRLHSILNERDQQLLMLRKNKWIKLGKLLQMVKEQKNVE